MLPSFRLALAAGLLCLAACQRSPDANVAPPPSTSATTPGASAPADVAPAPAAPAAPGAPDAAGTHDYVCADGTRVQLHDGEHAATDCAPAASADAGETTGDDAIADHYACDAGTRLTRRDDGSFRAEIPGSAPVRLARIAGSVPPVFTGASLYLRIDGNGDAILSQGDRTNELRCTSAQAPA